MPLEAGTHLGPYVIVSPIGEGGMGEVYRARDSRLGRIVAIKTIRPAALGSDQARARFQREARAISSLSHPNICTLHDVGQQNGVDYLVMEHLDGESLADRLARGPLPFDDVVRYGIEIASALEHAHRHGIIHRDLKPGNILLTKSGAKLLDFGLARTALNDDSRTVERAITADGAIPGTLQFVAPEQLAGKEADARSDIFAFGNVLYRMATARPPFAGDSAGSLIASITRDEPQRIEPAALNDLVSGCLRKDPDERMQSAHDCKLALEWMRQGRTSPAPAPRSRLAIATAAICGAVVPLVFWLALHRTAQAPVRRFTIDLPAPFLLGTNVNSELAVAPDGSGVVVSVEAAGGRQLFFRSFDQNAFVALDGTQNAAGPFFSPDSKWIGFTADGKLKKVRISGGAPVTICDAPRLRGATWGPDDTIVFAPVSTGGGLSRVSSAGGEVTQLTSVDLAHERSHRWPHFLPDGKRVMFQLEDWGADYGRKVLAVVDVDTKQRTTVMKGACDGRVLSNGLLLFGRDNALYAVRFDSSKLRTAGLPVPVVTGVRTHIGLGRVYADIANDGTLVYVPFDPAAELRDLVSVDRSGNAVPLTDQARPYRDVRFSPDGRQLLVATSDEITASDLWLLNPAQNSWSRIAPEGKNMCAIWSPTG
ncbi:MAG TPA: protein kinase, partial [Thermoanaerobaculia bacterium]